MYKNYGDKNFFEYGLLVDDEHSDTEFDILICRPYSDEEDLYQFAQVHVDITDTWIDKNAVLSYAGLADESDAIAYAIACLEYYGPENFGADSYGVTYDWRRMDKASILNELKGYLIAWDDLVAE